MVRLIQLKLSIFAAEMKKVAFIISCIVIILSAMAAACIGVINVPWEAVWTIIGAKISGQPVPTEFATFEIAIWNLRIPRILLSLLAGASLAICGASFQAIFRNPICDPYILGISSGASLGAAIAIILGLNIFAFGITGMALLTATLTLLLILGIAYTGKRKTVETILLAGITLNFLISALITMLMVLNQESLEEIIFWTMGSFASATWIEVISLTLVFLIGGFILFLNAKNLNIMQLGTETAQTSGVNTQLTTWVILISSSIMIASTVACCGVIGFIGLIIPHITRLMFGNNNRVVFAFSIVFGAFFCLAADTIARTIAAPSELPVGSITAIAGAPYFIFLLLTNRSKSIR